MKKQSRQAVLPRMLRLIVAGASLVLAACASISPEERRAQDVAYFGPACVDAGYIADSDPWQRCIEERAYWARVEARTRRVDFVLNLLDILLQVHRTSHSMSGDSSLKAGGGRGGLGAGGHSGGSTLGGGS